MARRLGNFWIKVNRLFFTMLLMCGLSIAQDAVHEESRMTGECIPAYASVKNNLLLYRSPNKESQNKVIPYGINWNIPYWSFQSRTRVIKTGELKAKEKLRMDFCQPLLLGKKNMVDEGATVEYLFYSSEGEGYILYNGSKCAANVLADFKLIEQPQIQVWMKVLFKDGSSPGWLLHDGSQTKVSGIEC